MLREEKTLCHPEPFDKLKINCVKDLKILRLGVYPEPAEGLLRMTYSQSFSAAR
jgi:hypothetical protein